MTGSQRKRGPGGVELAECVSCGRVGLVERIHRWGCPHDGQGKS